MQCTNINDAYIYAKPISAGQQLTAHVKPQIWLYKLPRLVRTLLPCTYGGEEMPIERASNDQASGIFTRTPDPMVLYASSVYGRYRRAKNGSILKRRVSAPQHMRPENNADVLRWDVDEAPTMCEQVVRVLVVVLTI